MLALITCFLGINSFWELFVTIIAIFLGGVSSVLLLNYVQKKGTNSAKK
jgi:hypothetical protein